MNEKELEAKIRDLETRIEREEAVTQIQNVMAKYQIMHIPTKVTETWKLYAQKTPGVTAEIEDWGVYEGIESVRKLYEIGHKVPGVGIMHEHHLTTPAIEVSKDAKTASAVFFSSGHETWVRGGKARAQWIWGKYAIDFVKEDGEWKIWHLHWFTTFRADYYKSWIDTKKEDVLETTQDDAEGGLKSVPPNKPTTYHKPYTPDGVLEMIPPYPVPPALGNK